VSPWPPCPGSSFAPKTACAWAPRCYGDCSYCCIHAYGLVANGPRYRQRSPENVADEMQRLFRDGVRLFVFEDDNFLVPSRTANLERCRRLSECVRERGLDSIGFVVKCRPPDVDPELFALLKDMGLVRAYIGIENSSDEGIASLNRRVSRDDNRSVRTNLDFIEEFSEVPSNFCRTEIYAGTPLKHTLGAQGRLSGSYMAHGYTMRDPRVEVLFRIAATAFAARNFKSDGVANLNARIRFAAETARQFRPGCGAAGQVAELNRLSTAIAKDSVCAMRRAVDFVGRTDVRDAPAVKTFTIELARAVAASDLEFVAKMGWIRRRLDADVAEDVCA
jgi:Radical SAM superfamily